MMSKEGHEWSRGKKEERCSGGLRNSFRSISSEDVGEKQERKTTCAGGVMAFGAIDCNA